MAIGMARRRPHRRASEVFNRSAVRQSFGMAHSFNSTADRLPRRTAGSQGDPAKFFRAGQVSTFVGMPLEILAACDKQTSMHVFRTPVRENCHARCNTTGARASARTRPAADRKTARSSRKHRRTPNADAVPGDARWPPRPTARAHRSSRSLSASSPPDARRIPCQSPWSPRSPKRRPDSIALATPDTTDRHRHRSSPACR